MRDGPAFSWSRLRNFILRGALVFLATALVVYGIASVRGSCKLPEMERASFLLMHQLDSFDHSYQFATSAAPDKIVRPLAELQQILMDTQALEVPGCLATAQEELLAYMGAVTKAFLAYGAQDEGTLRELVAQSDIHYEEFHVEIEEVRQCAPWCIR